MPSLPTEPDFAPDVDSDRARHILALRTRALATRGQDQAEAAEAAGRVMICRVGAELFGLDIAAIAAVVPMGRYARLPAARPAVLGLIGRAGRIYSIIDLGMALGLAGEDTGAVQLLLLRQDARRTALRVSRVLGVAAQAADAASAAVSARSGPIVAQFALPPGAFGDAESLVSLIDLDRLLRPFLSPLRPGDPSL